MKRSRERFFQDCLVNLLSSQDQRRVVLEAARTAVPQVRKRVGDLTTQQRAWLVNNWLPNRWWPQLPPVDQEKFLSLSDHNPFPELPAVAHPQTWVASSSSSTHANKDPKTPQDSPAEPPADDLPRPKAKAQAHPKTPAGSPVTPVELFPADDRATTSRRKARSSNWSAFGPRAKADRVNAIANTVLEVCNTPEEAAELLQLAVAKVSKTLTDCAGKLANHLNKNLHCCCQTLLPSLGKLREAWRNHPNSLASMLDDAVCSGGLSSAKRMRQMGYNVSNRKVMQWHRKRLPRAQDRKRPGRPSKVNNPINVATVRAVLERSSVLSSLTCVVKEKQPDGTLVRVRKERRTLTAQLSTIYRSSPSIYKFLAETQFRSIVVRHCQEFRRGFRKTDLCDHCLNYRKKILPRVSGFIRRCQETMSTACPGYWNPFLQSRHDLKVSLQVSHLIWVGGILLLLLFQGCIQNKLSSPYLSPAGGTKRSWLPRTQRPNCSS